MGDGRILFFKFDFPVVQMMETMYSYVAGHVGIPGNTKKTNQNCSKI